jgi:NAD(P)-dependent dehydrogenase (short-subunit alcohol dehydrogenase family)
VRKRVLLVGATGTIGRAVAAALSPGHEVVRIARRGADIEMDATSEDSIRAMFEAAGPFDALVSAMGAAVPGPLEQLSAEDFAVSFAGKVLPQISLVLQGVAHIARPGSFTLSSGILSTLPQPGFAAIAAVNAAVDGFCRAAALELPQGVRINCVRPVFVRESFPQGSVADLGGFPVQTAAQTAVAYQAAVEGDFTGRDLDPRDFGPGVGAATALA